MIYRARPNPDGGWAIGCGTGDHFWSGNGLDQGKSFLGFRAFATSWPQGDGTRCYVTAVVVPLAAIVALFLVACLSRLKRYNLVEMWTRFRAILLSHAVASWIATPVLWVYQLFLQPGPTPSNLLWSNLRHDPQFWLSFTVHEAAAPIFVPVILMYMLTRYWPDTDMFANVAILSGAYAIAGSLFLAWYWHRQNEKLIHGRL